MDYSKFFVELTATGIVWVLHPIPY